MRYKLTVVHRSSSTDGALIHVYMPIKSLEHNQICLVT